MGALVPVLLPLTENGGGRYSRSSPTVEAIVLGTIKSRFESEGRHEMCRYGYQQYSCHWACFSCRKSFKGFSAWMGTNTHGIIRICPECGGPLYDLGQDFKTPRKESKNQWKKIKLLFEKGITFHSCGCNGPGYRPKTYSEVKHGGYG